MGQSDESHDTSNTTSNESSLESPPLFDGSQISSSTFKNMFVALAEKHSMSRKTQSDLLGFLNIILPQDNNVPSTPKVVWDGLNDLSYATTKHIVCKTCLQEILQSVTCQNEECGTFGEPMDAFQYVTMDILPQIQRIIIGE